VGKELTRGGWRVGCIGLPCRVWRLPRSGNYKVHAGMRFQLRDLIRLKRDWGERKEMRRN